MAEPHIAAGVASVDVNAVPLADERARLARITCRGVGMTAASALFWLALAAVAAWAGLDTGALARFFVVGAAVVYPLGYGLNRLLGGDLTAHGSGLRGLVGMLSLGQLFGWPVVVALLSRDPALIAFALAVMLGVHFLPYAWLYRAPAYAALAVMSVLVASGVQLVQPARANVLIPLAMALLYAVSAIAAHRQNRRDAAAC